MKTTLTLLLLGSLGLQAAGVVKARILGASVTSGAGREPRGPLPPPRLSAELELMGIPPKAQPRFKAWSVDSQTLPAGKIGAGPIAPGRHALPLACAFSPTGQGYRLQGNWKGPLEPAHSLVVEVFLGRRRIAWATAPVRELLLPSGKPESEKVEP